MLEEDPKGTENVGFDTDESISQAKICDEIELENHLPSLETTVKLAEKSEPESKNQADTSSKNLILRWAINVRRYLHKIFFGKSSSTKLFWKIFVNGAVLAFLIATIYHHVVNIQKPVDWCDGVGFLWILYCLTYIFFLYSFVKQSVGKSIGNSAKPLRTFVTFLLSKKYIRLFCYWIPVIGLGCYVIISPGKSGRRIYSFLGIIVFIIFGFLFSKHPGHIKWRPVIMGIVLQFIFGIMTIKFEVGKSILDCIGNKVTQFLNFAEAGTTFIYGYLGKPESNSSPIFAFAILPVIFFLSFFVNILSYCGALQWCILKIGWIVRLGMGTTVCESVNAAASIFLGMSDTPFLIKDYIIDLTKSELCAVLCAGWSTVAGVVLAAYIEFGVKASHLIAASIMSAPASLSFSKLFYPETEESKNTLENIKLSKVKASNALDAASQGALAGLGVVAGITANIIAFLAFIAFLDASLTWFGLLVGVENLNFQFLLSKIFYPVSFLMGVEESSMEDVAYLVGIKTVANEFKAYEILGDFIKKKKLSERSEIIATYALCGFSNFGSIGISLGVFASVEPRRLAAVTEVAFIAFVAANIVCFLTACVAGCLIE